MLIDRFYINGEWVEPQNPSWLPMIDPATERAIGKIAMGGSNDVDRAVAAAKAALPSFASTKPAERADFLQRILDIFQERADEFATAMRLEMGSPISFARSAQVPRGPAHLAEAINLLKTFNFEEQRNRTRLVYEPVGVCALITPWNWPINQLIVKFAPAFAAGCTMVVKPSEYSALSARLFAEVVDAADVPPGVFNLLFGSGENVGVPLSAHPDVDAVSFTGSTRAGVEVARNAAPTVKRVSQELGGKTANIVLDDADIDVAVRKGVALCMANSGQSCAAPTRMLVPVERLAEVSRIAKDAASAIKVGNPDDQDTDLGPVVNAAQYENIQALIAKAEQEGATVLTGGPGRPDGLEEGYYVRPTIFVDVTKDMMIAQTEVFGPVLCVLAYTSEEEAIEIANSTNYGLSAHIQAGDFARAARVADKLVAGSIYFNYPAMDYGAPFGGRKRSGNGREWGEFGLREYLEVKSMIGWQQG